MTPRKPSRVRPIDRRTFLQVGSLGVGAMTGAIATENATQAQGAEPESEVRRIDVNVSLSRWPFRRLPCDETADLAARLRSQGIVRAWAGSFEALLHRDIAGVNARLADECREKGDRIFVPAGSVNPKLPDWEEDLRRCHEVHGVPAVRLYPNYHQYSLDDPDFARLLDLATKCKLIVQIALTMEDERTQHPLVQVPHVDARPLAAHAEKRPALRFVLVNAFRALPLANLGALKSTRNIWFDVAMLESIEGVAKLVQQVGAERVLFGSHAPFYDLESAILKMKESDLDDSQRRLIGGDNAVKLLMSK